MPTFRTSTLLLAAVVAAGALSGCAKSRSTDGAAGAPVTLPGVAGDGSDDVTVDSRWCTRCHGDAARVPAATDAAGIAFAPPRDVSGATEGAKVGAHQAHLTSGTLIDRGVNCSACHVVPAEATAHVPGVTFRGLAATRLGTTPAFTPTWDPATGTCNNTYCHGNFNGGLSADPGWTGTGATCGSCHALPPTLTSSGGAHPAIAACGTCHPGYTSSTVDLPSHVNGIIDLTGGCAACHGTNGRPDGDMSLSYDANQDAAPPASVGSASALRTGAHLAHVNPTNATGAFRPLHCVECHPDNTAGSHPGSGRNVLFDGSDVALTNAFAASVTLGDGTSTATTCSTYCHDAPALSGGSVSSAWAWNGAAATCGSCHGAPPTFMPDGTTPHPANSACAGCHAGYTATSVNLATHIDGTVQGTGTCTTCHGTEGRADGDLAFTYDLNQAAAPPAPAAADPNGVRTGVHLAHVNPSAATGVYRPIACTECHPDNTSGTHPGGGLTVTFAAAVRADNGGTYTASFTPGNGSTTAVSCDTYCHQGSVKATPIAWDWDGAAADCASCHDDPPATAGHTSQGVTSSTNCGLCHPGYSATAVNLDLHINGQLDGGESSGGQACAGCHAAIFNAMNGTIAKASKHALGNVAGTNDSATDGTLTWGSPLSSNLAASRSCVKMCHGDHPHSLTSPPVATHEYNVYLDATSQASRDGATRTSATRARTDFVIGEANGGLCTSCHRNPITGGGPTITAASYGATAHDYVTAAGFTWEFRLHTSTGAANAFQRNCTKCHASAIEGTTPIRSVTGSSATSVHFNDNASLLAGTSGDIAAGHVCYNCHGSTATPGDGDPGNRSGKNIQSQFTKASTHAVAGVTCTSCHDPHRAKAGTHATPGNLAGPPIDGAAGARLSTNPAFWAAPAAGNFTAKTVVAGTDVEATLCFKCHTAFAGTLPAGTTDVAREFNPNNVGTWYTAGTANQWSSNETAGGYHPVLATAANNLGRVNLANLVTTNQAWSTTVRNTMTCTDCHESNTTTDPNGPHGSAANFLLKGPNTAWSASVALVAGSTQDTARMQDGTFCINCHSQTFASSRFPGHRRDDHLVACFKCHAAVPHGGPRPGMLNAAAGAAAAVGGSIAGWDNVSPYWQGGATTDRLYLVSYPTSGTGNWSQGNCGCDGTGH